MSHATRNAARMALTVVTAWLALAATLAQAESGSRGFSLAVSVEGSFSPKVVRAEVKKVDAGSPAEAAGLQPGDLITRIDDCAIPGCPGNWTKALLAKEAGQALQLTVLRDGTEHEFTLHFAAKVQ